MCVSLQPLSLKNSDYSFRKANVFIYWHHPICPIYCISYIYMYSPLENFVRPHPLLLTRVKWSKSEPSPVNQTVFAYHTHVLFCWDARLMLMPVYLGRWKESLYSYQPPFYHHSPSSILLPLTLDVTLCQSEESLMEDSTYYRRLTVRYIKSVVLACVQQQTNTYMLMFCILIIYSTLQYLNIIYGLKHIMSLVFCVFC